jgi:hypothetical protein
MTPQTKNRSIAEVIMDGDGRYDDLIGIDKLRDGTYLVYEKATLFGLWEGFARVHRLDPKKKTELNAAVTSYQRYEEDYEIIRRLNDLIMPIKYQTKH